MRTGISLPLPKSIECVSPSDVLYVNWPVAELYDKSVIKISPDNKYKAIVFERACGATTGFNRHVLISSEKEPKLKKGNVLIINGNEVEVFWITSDVIRIKYLGKEVFKTDYINEIKIEYD